jgi:hypothetical protein
MGRGGEFTPSEFSNAGGPRLWHRMECMGAGELMGADRGADELLADGEPRCKASHVVM